MLFSSFSRSVVSNSLWPHELQHTRLPCPWPSPRACSNSCPLSQWFHPTISSFVIPFSSCPQSFPAQGCAPWGAYLSLSPIFPIYSGYFIRHFCSCWYYKDLICSFLLFMEFFDGQKLVIVINWMYQSFPLQFAFLCHFFFFKQRVFLTCYCKNAFLICLPHVGLGFCWTWPLSTVSWLQDGKLLLGELSTRGCGATA